MRLNRYRMNVAADWMVFMKSKSLEVGLLVISMGALANLSGCSKATDIAAEAPPATEIVPRSDVSLFSVDRPEQFPLAEATAHPTLSELIVTGVVTPDVSRNVPVVSLASGRVVGIHARLGDTVKKGQLILT
jgi:cobalt-zinc-cadmium efflux system membrane fusion protein